MFCTWFFNKPIAIGAYLLLLLLFPGVQFFIGSFPIGYNVINTLFLVLCFFYYRNNLKLKPVIPFIFLYGVQLLLMPIQDGMPIHYMWLLWFTNVMFYVLFPIVVYNVCIYENRAIEIILVFVCISIVLICLYGLYLTTIPGENPYQTFLLLTSGGDDFNSKYALAEDSGRLFGRISSVFPHPMTFAFWIGLNIIFLFFFNKKFKYYLQYPLLIILFVNSMTCGVRTVIAALFLVSIYFLYSKKQVKYIKYIGIGCFFLFVLSLTNEQLFFYVSSIIDSNSSSTVFKGSSLGMRVDQLLGCFDEIKDNILFGKGYGWNVYYKDTHGIHPVILAFESLAFVVLCNTGLFGVILWIFFVYQLVKNVSSFTNRNKTAINCLTFYYIAYSLITGEYGYVRYFGVFYVILYAASYKEKIMYNLINKSSN